MLDKRLKACAEMVSGRGVVCDVGTDHAYLAAELIKSGKCNMVIASDIKEGPLEAAARTVEKYGVSDKVTLVLSDGLKNVSLEGVSDIVIAGMGGETIAEILENIDEPFDEDIRLILQPMSKPEVLRKRLYEMGFAIVTEKIVQDGDKLYVIMCAALDEDFRYLTEYEAYTGEFDEFEPLAVRYRVNAASRLNKVAAAMENAGLMPDAVHYKALAKKLMNGTEKISISEVYDFLNECYPFSSQEKWDNSGILVENFFMSCSKILLTLDITDEVVSEAACKGVDLIVSHHPVIFNPLKRLSASNPVYRLVTNEIAAICAHTNLDISHGGTNSVILSMLSGRFELDGIPQPFEELGADRNLGFIIQLKEPIGAADLGAVLKELFGCEYVRMSRLGKDKCLISKIAFCSGSGGSMLGLAEAKGCDALITGDVKHDVWIESNNFAKTVVYDCGHFHTENIVLRELRRVLEERFPQLDIEISERSVDPCVYI